MSIISVLPLNLYHIYTLHTLSYICDCGRAYFTDLKNVDGIYIVYFVFAFKYWLYRVKVLLYSTVHLTFSMMLT